MNQNQLRDWAIFGVGFTFPLPTIRVRVFDLGGNVRGVFNVSASTVAADWIRDSFVHQREWNNEFVGAEIVSVSGLVYLAPVSTPSVLTAATGIKARVSMNIGRVALITGASDRQPNWRT